MSAVQRFKKFFMERVFVFVIVMALSLFTSLVLWLRTTFWVACAFFFGQVLLWLGGIAFIELRDRWRARRGRTD